MSTVGCGLLYRLKASDRDEKCGHFLFGYSVHCEVSVYHRRLLYFNTKRKRKKKKEKNQ